MQNAFSSKKQLLCETPVTFDMENKNNDTDKLADYVAPSLNDLSVHESIVVSSILVKSLNLTLNDQSRTYYETIQEHQKKPYTKLSELIESVHGKQ